jgi:hypothetical protein
MEARGKSKKANNHKRQDARNINKITVFQSHVISSKAVNLTITHI